MIFFYDILFSSKTDSKYYVLITKLRLCLKHLAVD